MNTNALVSIVVPVYNAQDFLPRCLATIDNQHYRPLEVVLVDDGSTDGSLAICEEYERNHAEGIAVKVLTQANSGASIARKHGVEATTGKFLAFIDSDDFVAPTYISSLHTALTRTKSDVAVCTYEKIAPGETVNFPTEFSYRLLSDKELFSRFFKYDFWGFCGGLYERDIFKTLDFPNATINEDYYVKAQLFTENVTTAIVEPAQYYYESHAGSLSNLSLSLRALGEFDNAVATWRYIYKHNKPYRRHALAIASEASCKLLGKLNGAEKTEDFKAYRKRIRSFVMQNFGAIFLNPHFYWKVKLVLLKNLL